jgi:enoyl-CoA hydratase/carnithine racemase
MTFDDLTIAVDNGVATITLNRPEKHNALRQQTFAELGAAFTQVERDPAVRVIVLTAAGTRVFCAGIDLEADGLPENSQEWDDHTRGNAAIISQLWYCDKPIITALNGAAIAGGCNLAMVGDLTVASTTAFLAEPEIRHGALSPLLMLPWLMQFKGFNEMYLTGDRMPADRARELGLVNYVVDGQELAAYTQRLAERVANAPVYALTLAKRAVRLTLDVQGFKAAQDAHRYIDTYLLASNGVTEKERLMNILATEGMGAFLKERDTPYGER